MKIDDNDLRKVENNLVVIEKESKIQEIKIANY